MDLVPVESSTLAAVGYEPDARTLTVRFKSGAEWLYADVDPTLHAALMAAKSKGKFFAAAIKNEHDASQLTPAAPTMPQEQAPLPMPGVPVLAAPLTQAAAFLDSSLARNLADAEALRALVEWHPHYDEPATRTARALGYGADLLLFRDGSLLILDHHGPARHCPTHLEDAATHDHMYQRATARPDQTRCLAYHPRRKDWFIAHWAVDGAGNRQHSKGYETLQGQRLTA